MDHTDIHCNMTTESLDQEPLATEQTIEECVSAAFSAHWWPIEQFASREPLVIAAQRLHEALELGVRHFSASGRTVPLSQVQLAMSEMAEQDRLETLAMLAFG